MKCSGLAFIPLVAVTAWAGSAIAQPLVQLDPSQTKVLALLNLSGPPNDTCAALQLDGTIVHREFDEKVGTLLTGVTIEEADGQRDFANVDVDWDSLDRVTAEEVAQGLQVLLKEGNHVALGVEQCGAAGRVLDIDSVRLAASSPPQPNSTTEPPEASGE